MLSLLLVLLHLPAEITVPFKKDPAWVDMVGAAQCDKSGLALVRETHAHAREEQWQIKTNHADMWNFLPLNAGNSGCDARKVLVQMKAGILR